MTQEFEKRFIKLRRAVIERHIRHLNPQQQQGVLTTEGPLLLLAGAGSGKTTVLIQRIANLIRYGSAALSPVVPDFVTESDVEFLECFLEQGAPEEYAGRADALCALDAVAPWNIIAITFTNKAANELKSRLAAQLGERGNDVWAMTFHSACCRILRRDIERLGYTGSFTIYDTTDSERVMKGVIRDMNLDEKSFPPKLFLNLISKAKDKEQSPEEFAGNAAAAGDFRMEKAAKAYAEYQKRLHAANALDFDDIILLTVRLLTEFDEVRSYYQKKFRYVLIDEYQDTNRLQYRLASLLAGGHRNICVVGDDDQSIYRFRGATIENILNFEKEYTGAQVIRLEQNYRSTKAILDAANAVIANNQGRKGKRLWTENADGDRITVYEAMNESEEAQFVASRIFSVGKGKNFRDFAVLYRTNAQSNAMEYAFKRNGIPYRIIGGTRFFDRAEVKDMLAYLWVINNRADDLRLLRIINNPPRGIGAKTLEVIARIAEASNTSLYSVISDPYSYPALERVAAKLMQFTVLIEECANLLTQLSLPDFYEELMIRTGYVAMLEEKHTEENAGRLENVRELKSSIISYVEHAPEPTLNGFLEEIALYTDIEQYDPEADAVVMMTMHAAKGLEFPHVCIVGMEDGLFPGIRAIGDLAEMEEERRLCYVAITRAKKSLAISYAKQRMLYGHTNVNRPSRFLGEIPPELLHSNARRAQGGENKQRSATLSAQPAPKRQPKLGGFSAFSAKPTSAPAVSFAKGDMVKHDAFGQGMVLTVTPMGGDALLEIAFDQVGTKRLLAKTASLHMRKL